MSESSTRMTKEVAGNGESVRSISRAFELLELFDSHNPRRHVRELAQLTGIPRTTVLRLLGTLEAHGFVLQSAESTYQVGPGALRWFRVVQDAWSVPGEVLDVIGALRNETGESVNIYVRQGLRRVSIGQAEGTHTVRSVVRMGVPLPLSAGSSGTVLMAHAPASVVAEVVSDNGVSDEISAKIEDFRKDHFAVSHGERESGASSLSLPVRCTNGAVVALSMSGPTSRFDEERIQSYLKTVRARVKEIEALGLGPVEALLTPTPDELSAG